jgi:hypothetical protein
MNRVALNAWRLHNQRLARPVAATPAQLVAWLGGVQAQLEAWARWSIGLRLPESEDTAVAQAVTAGDLVRTWAFRGTLHFISAGDVGWLMKLLAPLIIAGNAHRYQQLELTDADFSRSQAAIAAALAAQPRLSRSQLAASLEGAGMVVAGQRLPYLLQRAALDGLLCHAPALNGREAVYTGLPEQASTGPDWPGEAALAELARRYFAGHGPATLPDFAWWSGLPMAQARRGVAAAVPILRRLPDAGRDWWVAELQPPPHTPPAAYLLSPFDEYLLGYQARRVALDPAHVRRVNAGGGMPKPALLLDGRVAGVWQRTARPDGLSVTVTLFRSLDRQEEVWLEQARQRLAKFYRAAVTLTAA